MSSSSGLLALATRVGIEIKSVRAALAGKSGSDHAHPAAAPNPADFGMLGWTYDHAMAANNGPLTAGVVYLATLRLLADRPATSLWFGINAAGAGLSNCYAGLYRYSDGARLAVTADQSTAWQSVNVKNPALTASTTLPAGLYRAAILVNGTTPPALARGLNSNVANAGVTAPAAARFATFGSGLTALPETISPGSMTLSSLAFWAGVA